MSNVAELLRTLHRLLVTIEGLSDQLTQGPRQIAAGQHQLETVESSLVGSKETLKRARILSDEKQLQLKSREARIAELQLKLNAAASNREYQALKEQMQADSQANSVLTDEILELLDRIDQMLKDVGSVEGKVLDAKGGLDHLREKVDATVADLQSKLDQSKAELANMESKLPGDLRTEYDRLVRLRGSEVLARVEGNSCGGCYQTLTSQQMNELAQRVAVFCLSCGAILFFDE